MIDLTSYIIGVVTGGAAVAALGSWWVVRQLNEATEAYRKAIDQKRETVAMLDEYLQ